MYNKEAAENFFEELSEEFQNSVIFSEELFILSIKYNELFEKFLSSGGITIIDLNEKNIKFEVLKSTKDLNFLIFIDEFNETHKIIFKNIVKEYSIKNVLVFSSFSNYCLKQMKSSYEYKEIKKFFYDLDCDALIKQNLLTHAPLTKSFFISPQRLFPTISDEKILEFHHLSNPNDYLKLANNLKNFFSLQQQKVDIFSLGKNSKILGDQLKIALDDKPYESNTKTSLILMDRSVDLVSPFIFNEKLNQHLINWKKLTKNQLKILLGKDPFLSMRNELISIVSKENDFQMNSVVGKSNEKQLQILMKFMKENKKLKNIHYEKLKFSEFLFQVLNPNTEKNQLIEIIDDILMLLYEEPEVILKDMIPLIKEKKLNLEEIFSILVMIYSSVGPSVQFEFISELKFEVFQYFMKEKPKNLFLPESLIYSDTFDEYDQKRWELQVDEFLTNFMKKLELIKLQREDFKSIKQLYESEEVIDELSFAPPLIMSLCHFIEKEKKIVDLQKNISLLQSLKKSGLGFFGSLVDNSNQFSSDNFVLFVVGGMTLNEISLLNSMKKGNKKITFGTNSILQVNEILNELLQDL
eukprot:gene12094-5587_t